MKVEKQHPPGAFKPYKLVIEVETVEEHEMFVGFFERNIAIPDWLRVAHSWTQEGRNRLRNCMRDIYLALLCKE